MVTNDYSFVVLKDGKEVFKRDFTEEKFFLEMATFENIMKEKGEQVNFETLKKNVEGIIAPIPPLKLPEDEDYTIGSIDEEESIINTFKYDYDQNLNIIKADHDNKIDYEPLPKNLFQEEPRPRNIAKSEDKNEVS